MMSDMSFWEDFQSVSIGDEDGDEEVTIGWNNGFEKWSARSRYILEQQTHKNDIV
jgi:hypothetical protein